MPLWECPSAPSWAALLNPSSALPSLEEDFITWREQFWPAVCEHFGVEATGEESRWVPGGSTPCEWWLQHQAGATAQFLRAGGRTGSRSASGALGTEPVLGQIQVQLWSSGLKGGCAGCWVFYLVVPTLTFFLFPFPVSPSIRQYELVVHTDVNMSKVYTGEMGRLKSYENQKP